LSFDEVNRTDTQTIGVGLLASTHGDQILALPTLVRRLPELIKRIIGDLSNTERVLVGLDLRARRG
jgi:hypothetical protein